LSETVVQIREELCEITMYSQPVQRLYEPFSGKFFSQDELKDDSEQIRKKYPELSTEELDGHFVGAVHPTIFLLSSCVLDRNFLHNRFISILCNLCAQNGFDSVRDKLQV
jgi:hypothetical protein